MGCFPDISKMAETNQPVPLLIPEPEGEGFEAGEERDGRHGLKQRLRLVALLQVVIGNPPRHQPPDVFQTGFAHPISVWQIPGPSPSHYSAEEGKSLAGLLLAGLRLRSLLAAESQDTPAAENEDHGHPRNILEPCRIGHGVFVPGAQQRGRHQAHDVLENGQKNCCHQNPQAFQFVSAGSDNRNHQDGGLDDQPESNRHQITCSF